jgi:AcrR family transcriptional regulator
MATPALNLKPGDQLASTVCTTWVIVIRVPTERHLVIECGGQPMVPGKPAEKPDVRWAGSGARSSLSCATPVSAKHQSPCHCSFKLNYSTFSRLVEGSPVASQRRYATLLAKGEDRRQRILLAAQRLLTRNGSRGTTLGQIAREAGVTPAGLLHHFESKEQLLHAVLDARDADDLANANMSGDIVEELEKVTERFQRSPQLIGMFTVLLTENLNPDAPLHGRFLGRYRDSVEIIAQGIRRGQCAGRYRPDVDAAVKAVEIVAFLTGMEISWMLDPSIPLTGVFREYTSSLARQLTLSHPSVIP